MEVQHKLNLEVELLGLWLDLMILKVFHNLNESVIIKHVPFSGVL